MTGLALVIVAVAVLVNTIHTAILSKRISQLEVNLLEKKMRDNGLL